MWLRSDVGAEVVEVAGDGVEGDGGSNEDAGEFGATGPGGGALVGAVAFAEEAEAEDEEEEGGAEEERQIDPEHAGSV